MMKKIKKGDRKMSMVLSFAYDYYFYFYHKK